MLPILRKFAAALIASVVVATSSSAEVYSQFPEQVDANGHYVFYSHGFIVEGDNAKPVHNRWGVYDFPAVKQALADDSYHLIAYHRPKATDPFHFANKLATDVEKLIQHGVKAENISLIGFSRGAFITSLTSNLLAKQQVNTILLAGCGRIVGKKYQATQVYGHVLSIYEISDGAQSCAKLQQRSSSTKSFTELAISTGKEHGAFYRPIDEWIIPVKQWLTANKNNQ